MVGILVASHGSFSRYLIKTSEMIVGKQKNLISLGLDPHMGLQDMKQAINEAFLKVNENDTGVLMLVDLQGGTPGNAACMLVATHNMSIVSGVNLPMLLEVLSSRQGKMLTELTDIALRSGKEGIRDLSELIKIKLKKQNDG